MQRTQNLQKQRLHRLRNLTNILGQPDLLTILKATTISSFLSHKKVYEKQQKFIFGLNFPTTAHFSGYMSQRLNANKKINNNKSQIFYKIRFYMYDIFKKIDFYIEINIPGSVEMKAYNLSGQPVNCTAVDYQSVYYSSVLRSLYPFSYHPSTEIYGQIQNYQVLVEFIKGYINFSIKNQLQIPDDLSQIYNLNIELISTYLKQNSFFNLTKILICQLHKYLPQKSQILSLQLKQSQGLYKQIITQCAEHLLKQKNTLQFSRKLIEFQIRSLCKIKKNKQAKIIGEKIVRQGLDSFQTWGGLLSIYFQENDDRLYFKMLNTALNFHGDQILSLKQKLDKYLYPKKLAQPFQIGQKVQKGNCITNYPQFMLKFDYIFMQNQTKLKSLHQMLEKTQKQKSTAEIISRLNTSYQKQTFFQKFVGLYQKQRGWNKLIALRAQCFWLENDYVNYQNSIKKKNSQISYRYMNQTLSQDNISSKNTKLDEKVVKSLQQADQGEQGERDHQSINSSFQGQFSDAQSNQNQIHQVAPCSKRVATKRVSRQMVVKKVQFSKTICNYNLQKIFLVAYNNLKLHSDIEKWSSKLDFNNINQLSKQKKQLLSYIFLKKAFFHKNMLRYRKSQQAFKFARKCSNSSIISLISCYCLAKLYLEHNNIKGVQFYTVQIVRILFALGIQKFRAIPQWAKQIIPYIIKFYGKSITKRLQGPLKQLVQLWIKIDNKSINS